MTRRRRLTLMTWILGKPDVKPYCDCSVHVSFQGILFLAFLLRIASKMSSAMSIVIEQLPEPKDVAPVERQDDDVSWMELNFVENDDNKSFLSFAEHCAISVTLGGDDNDDYDEASLSSKEQKPSSYSKPTSRRRPKKTTLHKKSKSFDDILLGSDKKKKKKKKEKKKSKAGEDLGECSSKPKRKTKKRASAFATSTISDDDSLEESLESFVSSASGSSKRKVKRSFSLSPKRDGRSGIVQKMSNRGAGLVKQISFRAKGLKDQLAQSEHGPSDRAGLMGQILYSGFDDGSDLEDELDFH
jgi:hypothetical protein